MCRVLVTLLILGSFSVTGQVPLQNFLQQKDLKSAHVGICLQDVKTGEILLSHNGGKLFTPASTLKLLTTYAGLRVLGSHYKFKTILAYSGEINGGILHGDILIIGGGDPTLGSDKFMKALNLEKLLNTLATVIQDAGIAAIQGDIVMVDNRYEAFGEQGRWPVQDIGNYYGASAYGINIHENAFQIHFARNQSEGAQTVIHKLNPRVDSIRWQNEVTTGPSWSGDNAYVFGSPFSWERLIRGTIPAGNSTFTIKGSLPFPALHLGLWLKDKLQQKKVVVTGDVQVLGTEFKQEYRNLAVIESPLLLDILREMNERSVNLYTEAVLKEIAYVNTGIGSTKEGIITLEKLLSFIEDDMHFVDASGLSPFNGISPEAYCRFLSYAVNSDVGLDFLSAMAIYGRKGTLRYVLQNTSLDNNARGKSGSISGVRAYTGVLTAASGRQVSFGFFLNKFHEPWSRLRPAFEKLMVDMARTY